MTCSHSCWSLHFLLTNTDAHSDWGHQSFSLLWATLRAIRRFKNELAHKLLTQSYQRCQSCISCARARARVCVCVCLCLCVSTLWDVGLTSDQAVTSSLFPSSTILMLKLVMNYFYSHSHSFLLKGQLSVTGKTPLQALLYLYIRWEQLGVISLHSPPINWEKSKCGPS